MKSYVITVNGNTYEVSVEEQGSVAPAARPVTTQVSAPVAKPAQAQAAPKAEAKAAQVSGSAGSAKVTAPMPGTVLSVSAVVGQAVKNGDVLLILEAMKMENEIMADRDGVVASVNVGAGTAVNAGDVLVTLN